MKITFSFFVILSLILNSGISKADSYAEYAFVLNVNQRYLSKMYGQNGDLRTEVGMDFGGGKVNTVTLMLKSNPGTAYVFNSLSKTYTETKLNNSSASNSDFTITVIGNEKVGAYNCNHIKMTSGENSWEMWYTQDLPPLNVPLDTDPAISKKIQEQLGSKGINGVLVKLIFVKPGTNLPAMTMKLLKYESKPLDAGLFKIPDGYKKSTVNFDEEKFKKMTPEQQKEMMIKLMKEQAPKH